MRRLPGPVFVLCLLASFVIPDLLSAQQLEPSPPDYAFEIERDWLTMKDGTKLSVTYFKPIPKAKDERFPVIFEFLPYRKDDLFYLRDYPLFTYFVRRGYVVAKADIRGTGSSEGFVPPREYSEVELDDAVEIIGRLSAAPWSDGNVGMWGISWGGFNAIQVAMRQPAGLKAIMASCATDDLYHDDVHYVDGALHVDQYELRIDTKHGMPRWPDYRLDEAYFEERFNAYPWFITYLKEQLDGDFWRKNSLRWDYGALKVPAYLLGGLLDGYRDSVPRMLENVTAPVKADLGPYNHAWPDNGVPGPNYEWRRELVRWWDYWLKGRNTGIMEEPRFAVFVREGHPPDRQLKTTPGHWRYEDWPIKQTDWAYFYPSENAQLRKAKARETMDALEYVPSSGVEAEYWWGEPTGDMRGSDAHSLVYDSEILNEAVEIIGFPKVRLKVSADSPLAHWVARLEDVSPDGRVSLVTGGLINGSQRSSRLKPELLTPGQSYDLEFDLHFTTWTYQPGHRIRLAVSNAQFPMIWPTPFEMTTKLFLGVESSRLELPVINTVGRRFPEFHPPEPREQWPDARSLDAPGWPYEYEVVRNLIDSSLEVRWKGESRMEIGDRQFTMIDKTLYRTNDSNPADSAFQGETVRTIDLAGRTLELKTSISLHSDEKNFYVKVTRRILEQDELVRERTWEETIPRNFQ